MDGSIIGKSTYRNLFRPLAPKVAACCSSSCSVVNRRDRTAMPMKGKNFRTKGDDDPDSILVEHDDNGNEDGPLIRPSSKRDLETRPVWVNSNSTDMATTRWGTGRLN